MRGIKIHVHVHGLVFTVPCGAGTQEMRWLATVAAQRFSAAVPAGRMRQREPTNEKRGVYLPTDFSMCASDGSALEPRPDFLHPRTKIADSLRSGDHVAVQLNLEGGLEAAGPTQWQELAFSTPDAVARRETSRLRVAEARDRHDATADAARRVAAGLAE